MTMTFSPFIDPAGMLGFLLFDITRKGGFFGWKRSISVKSRLRLCSRQAESGTSVAEIIRKLGISEQPFNRLLNPRISKADRLFGGFVRHGILQRGGVWVDYPVGRLLSRQITDLKRFLGLGSARVAATY